MAHFAELDDDNIVERVIVVNNEVILDKDGNESEEIGQAFIASIGLQGKWVQCSYNASFRNIYPQPGSWFDEENNRFLRYPSPYASWSYDEDLEEWVAPIAKPLEGLFYWDEEAGAWTAVE